VRVRASAKSFSDHWPFANSQSFCPQIPKRSFKSIEGNAATSPNVRAPKAANAPARCSPTPDNSRRLRAAKKFFSLPALTSKKPGFAASVASFASQRESAKPPDKCKPTSRKIVALNSCQRSAPLLTPDKSKTPSSTETGTTKGENLLIAANIRAEIRRYSSGRAGQTTSPAHNRRAAKTARPDLMPNAFARRFADKTNPSLRRPPATISGRPRNAGESNSSHEAKKLSASKCKMRLGVFIQCSPAKKTVVTLAEVDTQNSIPTGERKTETNFDSTTSKSPHT